jgi:hypothetical protein
MLLRDVYNALRANADLWHSTLLVVLYDEHGGFFDSVEPPGAAPPSPPQPDWEEQNFNWFNRLGIRVPAVLVSPWVKRGVNATPFDHTSLLKYLTGKWGLGPLGDRVASPSTHSLGPLITESQPRMDTVATIELTDDQQHSPNPDLEEKAAAFISSHHKALTLLGRRLQWELLKESPLTFAWVTYPVETILHWLFGLGNRWVFRLAHKRTMAHWQKFLARRKDQAVTKMAKVVRHPPSTDSQHFAALTLGLAAGESFQLSPQPVQAAIAWLDRHRPG